MVADIEVLPFSSRDTEELVAFWNRNLPLDAITRDVFELRVLLDPNFQRDALLLAKDGGEIIGFVLGISPLHPIGLQEDRAWITMMAVDPAHRRKGLGRRLLQRLESYFKKQSKASISVATYPPGYFIPGVDIKEYGGAVRFFESMGFVKDGEAISMDASLVLFKMDEGIVEKERQLSRDGITVQAYQRDYLLPFLDFLERNMPWDWARVARENLKQLSRGQFDPDQIFIALKDGQIIGYCQYEGSHFGPFGVREDFQGRGIGTVLLARTLERMHQKGYHCAWVLWTDDRAAKLYGRFGFKESRRFVTMRKDI